MPSYTNKRKLLSRLGQTGTWSGPGAPSSSGADLEPPAERCDPPHSGTSAERGNPVVFLASDTKEVKDSLSQERPMRQREGDQGTSQGPSVIEGIEGASPHGQQTFTRKRADFPVVFPHERTWPTNLKGRRRYDSRGNPVWCGPWPARPVSAS